MPELHRCSLLLLRRRVLPAAGDLSALYGQLPQLPQRIFVLIVRGGLLLRRRAVPLLRRGLLRDG
jgi:hypothetical protein